MEPVIAPDGNIVYTDEGTRKITFGERIKRVFAKLMYRILKPYIKVKWFINSDYRPNFWVEIFGVEVARFSFDPLKNLFEKVI